MGLYEVEDLDNLKTCSIAVNPKEYFEKFENRSINKKHKGVRKNTKDMSFEVQAERITPLKYFDEKIEQKNNGSKKVPGQKYQNENGNGQ